MAIIIGKPHICTPGIVFDGDTLNLSTEGEQFICRLQWIDCPEAKKSVQNSTDPLILSHWQWAIEARNALMNLVQGKQLIAIPLEKDIYDRWVCDVYVGATLLANNVQINLCKLGLGVTFAPFNKFDFTARNMSLLFAIIKQTTLARKNKIGIWSVPNFILPHEFKKLTNY